MKKFLIVLLILVSLLAAPLNAGGSQYPNWEWINGVWVYTGNELPPPLPPPDPPESG